MHYRLYKKPNRRYGILLTVFIILLITGVGWKVFSKTNTEPITKSTVNIPIVMVKSSPIYASATGNYLFSGTVMLGRGVEYYAKGNYEQPFSGMSTLGTYDMNIGDLECPITSNSVSYQTEVDSLIFNCNPGWLPALKEHFPLVNLSSNHLNDMGPAGYNETVTRLQAAGFQTVGNFNPHTETDDCRAVLFPIRLIKSNEQSVTTQLPIAVCSYNYKIIFSPNPGELESIQRWSKIMPVIGLMNGGPEYQHTAGASQVAVAHQMIDLGADFVIGNGTHWAQNTEVYKNKLIVYSLGNFIFDQLDIDGRLALNMDVTITLKYDSNLQQWLNLAKQCPINSGDICLNLAISQNLLKLQPSFIFKPVVSYGGSLQIATLANQQQTDYIMQRANWSQTELQLKNVPN